MSELIRKKDALDALMAERKHLLANGQKGAEHVLTHHGYNVIDELPPVQSDVPVINVGDMISRQAAIDALKQMRKDGDMVPWEGKNVFARIRKMPSAQPDIIRCRNCKFASGDSRICMKFGHSPIGELDFCAWAERRTDERTDSETGCD